MNHTIKKTITLTDEDIENIMSAALQGMTYWADDAKIQGLVPDDMYVSEGITHGKRISIHDAEEEKWHILTLNKFMNGIALAPKIDYADYDMYDAEQVVQYALFGKLVYA